MFDFVSFIPRAIVQGIPLLFGSTGETLTEKSGNLKIKSMSFENEDRLIGDVIQVIVALFAVMILISIYVIKM